MIATQQIAELEGYQNPTVVTYFFKKNQHYSHEECLQLFADLMAWFKLKAIRSQSNKKTWLFGPLLVLDELWHCFILHSREYFKFSEVYFGHYLHHDIEPIGAEHHLSADEVADFLQDGFHYLGEAWVMRYFGALLSD